MRVLRVVSSGQDAAGQDAAGQDAVGVVVAAEDGERFVLTVDDALIEACNPAQDGPERQRPVVSLSPRDIQTRIRAGESPDDLADETGMELAQIMRFGYAVMQERSRVGDEARRGRARREGDGALVPFGETVDRRFAAHGIDPAGVHWDAFRRPDGTWTISATWNSGAKDRHAYWSFVLAGRTVLPADEPAADLLSDRPLRAVVRAVPDVAEEMEAPGDGVYDQENPHSYPGPRPATHAASVGGARAAEDKSDAPAAHGDGDGYGTTPLPLRLADPVQMRLVVAESVVAETVVAEAELAGTGTAETGTAETVVAETVVSETVISDVTVTVGQDEPATEAGQDDAEQSDDSHRHRPVRRSDRERTKVPSWEDIYLGVKRNKD